METYGRATHTQTAVTHPYRSETVLPFEAPVLLMGPEGGARSLPYMEGQGSVGVDDGRVFVRGRVYKLTAWWLKVGAPLLILLTGYLAIAIRHGGVWLGLGLVLALVGADVYQRHAGRSYSLRIPKKCGYHIDTFEDATHVEIQLDRFVVGGGSRPPVVRFRMETGDAKRLELPDVLGRG